MNSTTSKGGAESDQANSDFAAILRDEKVLVVGGGTMGSGIAQVLLAAGVEVHLSDVTEEAVAASRSRISTGLERMGELKRLDLLTVSASLPTSCDVGLAIETVPEDEALKRQVLRSIERATTSRTLIASNTSCISIEGLSRALSDPGRFFGMHFFNPVPRSSLIEIVTGSALRSDVLEQARVWVKLLGKEDIVVRDSPGFATSRLGVIIGLEAIRMLEENVASAEDIDRGMELGYRFPMGPLRLTDLVGLDVRLAIADKLAPTLGDRFNAPELLREKVRAGDLGKKTGRGFFEW
ncbi:MAG TPA: 3-hydroxyacyl-CoA dehydrogenase family protein [Acidimicrobiales bacterium]|jgi:3-hydroxybutyryl-CoA dehydrogenase|nr:3-hydroxyacyl-CoA dehydrogenase family protein [Acidimicrobiales bacterium]